MKTRAFVRTWPVWLALLGVGLIAYGSWSLLTNEKWSDDEEYFSEDEGVPPDEELLGSDERYELVDSIEVDRFETFAGDVRAGGVEEIRALQGMRVEVVKIHREQGELFEKGDPLISFNEERIQRALDDAKKAGETQKISRFQTYWDNRVLYAPANGQVVEIMTALGEVGYDEGKPLMTITDPTKWRFVVVLPVEIAVNTMPLGAKFTIELPEGMGTTLGTVTRLAELDAEFIDPHSDGKTSTVALGLDPHEGLEANLEATLRVPTGSRELSVVPRAAVRFYGSTPVVRVFEDGEILERTLSGILEKDDVYIVEQGVHPGEAVVIGGD